jgi:flavodoxin
VVGRKLAKLIARVQIPVGAFYILGWVTKMFEVVYYSRGGNTKKIAEVIADELGVKAENAKTKQTLAKDSFVFLGSGCYAGKASRVMQKFIRDNEFRNRRVALFGTSGSGEGKELNILEELLAPMGGHIQGKFYCRGKFLLSNRGRPDEKDIENARMFAKDMKKKV